MYKLTEREEFLCNAIVDAAFKVHQQLGPGLLEKIYETCFCYELDCKGIRTEKQLDVPVVYKSIELDQCLRLDVLVDGLIVCELKAVETVNPVWQAQVLSHLKLSGLHVGFLLNFNVPLMKQGLRRYCAK